MSHTLQFFLGYWISPEISISLHQSKSWQEALLTGRNLLFKSTFNGKEYLGMRTFSPQNLKQIQKMGEIIKSELQLYCPKINLDNRSLFIFTEFFFN